MSDVPPPAPPSGVCPPSANVRVSVRVRPSASVSLSGHQPLHSHPLQSSITIGPIASPTHQFTYDSVFSEATTQEDVYKGVGWVLDGVLDGFNATILAYGQTGSGKTYTMGSAPSHSSSIGPSVGLIPRFLNDLFKQISSLPTAPLITASFLEVYGEDVHDLLNPPTIPSSYSATSTSSTNIAFPSLPIREDISGPTVVGLTNVPVSSAAQALEALQAGTKHRTTASTLMNMSSSRSHAIFTLTVASPANGTSKLTFVDLAGSERMKRTGASGQTMKEGIQINVGLLALGNVINALASPSTLSTHVPYRQSRLTRLLSDALGGNSRTVFLACVSPNIDDVSETLSTLKYANRARNIRNAPIRNISEADMQLRRYAALSAGLRLELSLVKFNTDQITREDVQSYLEEVEERALKEFDDANPMTLPPPSVKSVLTSVGVSNHSSSLGESLDPTNPDDDMAILDQLMELQQADSDHTKSSADADEEIQAVGKELREQENLFEKLRGSLKVYHGMKDKYERLLGEVAGLEQEKVQLADQLATAQADPRQSKAIRTKLEKVEECLGRARAESRKQKELYRSAEKDAAKARAMERKVDELKSSKANLIRRQRETATRHREWTEAKTREIQTLKKKTRQQSKQTSKLESECKKHQNALERRSKFVGALKGKLKRTEEHLMRLLAMRKRELEKRGPTTNAAVGSGVAAGGRRNRALGRVSFIQPPSWNNGDAGAEDADTTFAPRTEETSSLKFLLENYVTGRIELVEAKEKYATIVDEHMALMNDLMVSCNTLSSLDEDASAEVREDMERHIEEIELRMEMVGSEMEDLRQNLGPQLTDDLADGSGHSIQDASTLKVIGDMTAPVARVVVLDLMESLTVSEISNRGLEKEKKGKDARIAELEAANAELTAKVERFVEAAREGRPPPNLEVDESEEAAKQAKFEEHQRKLAETQQLLSLSEQRYHSAGLELAECKEKLSVVDVSKEMTKETATALAQLQAYWRLLGTDLNEREKVRHELEGCVEEKCNALLKEASRMEHDTRAEIEKLRAENAVMQKALGREVDGGESDDDKSSEKDVKKKTGKKRKGKDASSSGAPTKKEPSRLSLLKQKEEAEATNEELGPIYEKAKTRRVEIEREAKKLLGALEQKESDVSDKLRKFLKSKSTDDGIYAEDLLSHCEAELRGMRVMKSELLVKSAEAYEKANRLARETHSGPDDVLALVRTAMDKKKVMKATKKNEISWWKESMAKDVCEFVCTDNRAVGTGSLWGKHLRLVVEALDFIAVPRAEVSEALKEVVDGAHKELMRVVDGEDGDLANDAYRMFHQALLSLPRLSPECISVFVDELESLVNAAQIMSESETEALTVLWDALDVEKNERGGFWADLDKRMKNFEKSNQAGVDKNVFDTVLDGMSGKDVEPWLLSALEKCGVAHRKLRARLFRLGAIHGSVESGRAKQECKSAIHRLDSELRIVDARLAQFEEKAGDKSRLVSKKGNGGALLKEEKFRKHMQTKFVGMLGRLRGRLAEWEGREGHAFDLRVLSEEIRNLLVEGSEGRTVRMHLRGVGGHQRHHATASSSADKEKVNAESVAAAVEKAASMADRLTQFQEKKAAATTSKSKSQAKAKKSGDKETTALRERRQTIATSTPSKPKASRAVRKTRARMSIMPFGNVLSPSKENEH